MAICSTHVELGTSACTSADSSCYPSSSYTACLCQYWSRSNSLWTSHRSALNRHHISRAMNSILADIVSKLLNEWELAIDYWFRLSGWRSWLTEPWFSTECLVFACRPDYLDKVACSSTMYNYHLTLRLRLFGSGQHTNIQDTGSSLIETSTSSELSVEYVNQNKQQKYGNIINLF